MSAAWLVGLLFAVLPQSNVACESVDLIEVNHFYDEHGRLVFDQVIFYDWSVAQARYNVRAWRLIKTAAQLPQRDWLGGGYRTLWQDGEQLRRVHAAATRETWTQFDPELVEREFLPKERRNELRTVHYDKPTGAKRPCVIPPCPAPEPPTTH